MSFAVQAGTQEIENSTSQTDRVKIADLYFSLKNKKLEKRIVAFRVFDWGI